MATVTPPARRDMADARRRVRDPLDRLRGYIRTYVSLEGAAVVGIYLALWFWIGLALDFGAFKLFGVDWVQSFPWGFRCGALVVLAAGLLAAVGLNVVTRLLREFRDDHLALVLERRFPDLLGDRLITAVELADLRRAAEQGYSVAMVEQTVHEAAERVEKLPIREVFDWRRLYRLAAWVGVLTLGAYLLVGVALAGVEWATGVETGGFGGLNEVSAIWFERNVLLQDTIWPRQAFLEILSLPPGAGITVGRDTPPPPLRVRALKYVVAGAPGERAAAAYAEWLKARGTPEDQIPGLVAAFRKRPAEGWRALTWFDLRTPGLLGAPVPENAVPADWEPRDPGVGLTLDEIDLRLDKPETHQTLASESQVALRGVLEQLDRRVAGPGMRRTLRKLRVPDVAYLLTRGNTTRGRATMERGLDNEYSGQFGELKESGALPWSFTFTVQGEDYYTAPRPLTVVAPPGLSALTSEERRPAYLYYRAVGGNLAALQSKKQAFEGRDVLQSSSDVSRVEVPAGTDVVLTARATKDLTSVRLLPRKPGLTVRGTVEQADAQTFRARFDDVRDEQQALFEMRDADGVVGLRAVVVRPKDDFPPDVSVDVDDVIRKTKDGRMVTALARIPFSGDVRDDNGLAEVRYAYTVARAETTSGTNPVLTASAAGLPPVAGPLAAAGMLTAAVRETRPADPAERQVRYLPVNRFRADVDAEARAFALAPEKLGEPQRPPFHVLSRAFRMSPDVWDRPEEEPGYDFPLWKVNLKAPEGTARGRYKMQLWVEAVDTDVDSEKARDGTPQPHVSPSKEKFTFVIVSETELLNEIGKEEEALHADLQKVLDRLLEAEAKLHQVTLDLTSSSLKPENLGPMSVRTDDIDQNALDKGQAGTREVALRYLRVLKEMRINRVDPSRVEKVDKDIASPLAEIAEFEFPRTHDALMAFRKALDDASLPLQARVQAARNEGESAKKQVRVLIGRLEQVLSSMKSLITLNELIRNLQQIEEDELRQADMIAQIRRRLEENILDRALDLPGGADKKKDAKDPKP
jgi:hypothetical protein